MRRADADTHRLLNERVGSDRIRSVYLIFEKILPSAKELIKKTNTFTCKGVNS